MTRESLTKHLLVCAKPIAHFGRVRLQAGRYFPAFDFQDEREIAELLRIQLNLCFTDTARPHQPNRLDDLGSRSIAQRRWTGFGHAYVLCDPETGHGEARGWNDEGMDTA